MMILLVIFSCFAISAVVSSLPFLQVMISYFVLCEGNGFRFTFLKRMNSCIVFSVGNDFLLSSL